MLGFRLVVRLEAERRYRRQDGPLFQLDTVSREERLRKLMHAVAQTQAAQAAGIADAIIRVQTGPHPQQLLSALPTTPIAWYLERKQWHRFTKVERHRRQRFEYNLHPAPRIAVLMAGFENTDTTQCYPEGYCEHMESFRPEAIAGSVPMLRRLATSVFTCGTKLRHLKRPIIVFTGLPFEERTLLTDEDRSLFWRAFGLPVTERYLGFGLETLAKECEAHDGLHLNLDTAIFQTFFDGKHPELIVTSLDHLSHPVLRLATGLSADITFQPCRCGQPGPRLMKLGQIPHASWQTDVMPRKPPVPVPALAAAVGGG